MSAPAFAVLGLGEAGGRLAADLAQRAPRCEATTPRRRRCRESRSRPIPRRRSPAARSCSASVSAASSRGAAAAALAGLAPGAVYADLNTAAPALKRELAALVEPAGGRFADVALLGPVPARGLATPALASGPGAEAFAAAVDAARDARRGRLRAARRRRRAEAPALRLHEGSRRRRDREPRRGGGGGPLGLARGAARRCDRPALLRTPARGQPEARGAPRGGAGRRGRPARVARDRAADRCRRAGPSWPSSAL